MRPPDSAKEAECLSQGHPDVMDMAVINHDGVRMLPMMPDTQTLLKESNYTANGYYGLVAFLPAGDGRARPPRPAYPTGGRHARAARGLVAGICHWFGQIDHAYTTATG